MYTKKSENTYEPEVNFQKRQLPTTVFPSSFWCLGIKVFDFWVLNDTNWDSAWRFNVQKIAICKKSWFKWCFSLSLGSWVMSAGQTHSNTPQDIILLWQKAHCLSNYLTHWCTKRWLPLTREWHTFQFWQKTLQATFICFTTLWSGLRADALHVSNKARKHMKN